MMPTTTARTVTVVADRTPFEVLQTILDVGDYDVVNIEPVAGAYSRIKRTSPQIVILCLEDDQEAACQVLSMLKLDSSTSRIPVVTCVAPRNDRSAIHFGDDSTSVRSVRL